MVGSFVATLVIRWPRGLPVSGRSRCDGCGRQLRAAELVPLLSFALARGHCRQCGAAIDWRHPAIELTAAVIGAVAFTAAPGWQGLAGATLGWFLLALGALDAEHRWLPDRLTLPLLVLGLLFGFGDWADRLIGAIVGGSSLWLVNACYKHLRGRDGLGGGDIKLFAALGAWLNWPMLPPLLLLAAMLGLLSLILHHLGGGAVRRDTLLPLGSLLTVAFPLWAVMAALGLRLTGS